MDTAVLLSIRLKSLARILLILALVVWTESASPLKASSLCLSKPCQNGAVCQEGPSDYLCQCQSAAPAPSNSGCDASNGLCQLSACLESMTCQPTTARSRELVCHCERASSGHPCQSRVELCAQGHCGGGARCRVLSTPQEYPGYSCLCQPGYVGSLCETQVDQCTPNPCRNRAICRSRGDRPTCFCVPGFQGVHCEIEVNECASQPCHNGATCLNEIGRYSCLCRPGYTGASCEVQIDECQSQPCLNEGSCHDYINGFSCRCVTGFQGDLCEMNVDECRGQPCQNGAACIDGINSYSCNCSQFGFMGRNCEIPIPPCTSQPCFNSALCAEDESNYTCKCWPGFEGRHCEVDVNECGSGPCLHGGLCFELSWPALYGVEPLLPVQYDPSQAAGFICSCQSGLRGAFCEEDVNECDASPCENRGTCQNSQGGYACICSPESRDGVLYGGPNCAEPLVGCDGHECQNGASCAPFLSEGQHGYSCACPGGFSGSRCQTPTGFSFERAGRLLLRTPPLDAEASSNVTLSFRTVLESAVLFQRGGGAGGPLLTLELRGGWPCLSLKAGGGADVVGWALELPRNMADGRWHTAEAVLADGLLSLGLLGEDCEGGSCERLARVESGPPGLEGLRDTLIGSLGEEAGGGPSAAEGPPTPAFIGCLRDLFVDSQLMVPEDWLTGSAVNVTRGCSHRDRCEDGPCENRGQCINLWQGYQCRCQRPHEGQNCSEEYITGRFGNEDSQSYAVFRVSDNHEPDIAMSLFVRTRRPTGLLLALANSSGQYLRVWLERGRVKAQVHDSESVRGEGPVSDGDVHFVSVTVEGNQLSLFQAGRRQGSVPVPAVRAQAGDEVYVGGLRDQRASDASGGYFKGCVQDLRLNGRRLEFFPLGALVSSYALEHMANVTRGCAGDDSCTKNPCQNGGMCYSMWDDFTCNCPPNTAGQRCEELKWCELSPCPSQAVCQTLAQGYECISNATFRDDLAVCYRGNGRISRNLTGVSLSLRTRSRDAAVLHAQRGLEFVTLSVQGSFLVLELLSGGGKALSLRSLRPVSDGVWHGAELFMAKPWAGASQWSMLLDGHDGPGATSAGEGGDLDFLREGVDILLGGRSLAGCLGTVWIGGIALPYHGPVEVKLPRPQEEQFTRVSAAPVRAGCQGAGVCEPNPCLNGGTCDDLFDLFGCWCTAGRTGRACDFYTDTCASGPCVHGNCSARGPAYDCACESGYSGADCEEEKDVCEGHKCAHGGTCLHGINKYACLCAENYTGPYCNDRIEEAPWYIIVSRIKRPKLPVSVCGNELRNYTCFNGGNCTKTDLTCDCLPGFTGHRCERELDECKSNPCLNGGYCRNLINKFQCVCDMSYAGEVCQIDVSDIDFYVAVLLWQNLFQLLSYLILRLDDEGWADN